MLCAYCIPSIDGFAGFEGFRGMMRRRGGNRSDREESMHNRVGDGLSGVGF